MGSGRGVAHQDNRLGTSRGERAERLLSARKAETVEKAGRGNRKRWTREYSKLVDLRHGGNPSPE